MTAIKNKTIQHLIDKHAGYGQLDSDRRVLDQLIEEDTGKHLFSRKGLYGHIRDYINRTYLNQHGRLPETDAERNTIIRITGTGRDTGYDEADILRMIRDPFTQKKLRDFAARKTTVYNGKRVPKVVARFYQNQAEAERAEAEADELAKQAGYRSQTTDDLLLILKDVTAELIRRKTETNRLENPEFN